MNASTRSTGRTLWVAVRAMVLFTLVLGVGYTLVVTAIGQTLLPRQANGSLRTDAAGEVVGSTLIGQSYVDAAGRPLPRYFQPRPSAAGDGYDARTSSGSNAGPENPELVAAIETRRAQVAAFNNVSPDQVPADAVTASGSGLDPDISPEYARIQVHRVADARGISDEKVAALVASHTRGAALGFIGQPTVNVLDLNLALDAQEG